MLMIHTALLQFSYFNTFTVDHQPLKKKKKHGQGLGYYVLDYSLTGKFHGKLSQNVPKYLLFKVQTVQI